VRTVLAALVLGALVPPIAHAAITVGSDLTLPPDGDAGDCYPLSMPPCTYVGTGVHAGNQFPVKSPTYGTVTSFQIRTEVGSRVGETVTFRLARLGPYAPPSASGEGTGPTITIDSGGFHSVPANLPVKPDDYIGIDTSLSTAFGAYPDTCGLPSSYHIFHPALTDLGSLQVEDANGQCELLVNAKVVPSVSVQIGDQKKSLKYKVAKGKNKITLPIELPGPGGIKISSKGLAGLVVASKARTFSTVVDAAGAVKLRLKLAKAILRKLNARGKATLKLRVTFTPVGGDAGTQGAKLRLKRG
jgi:hypothetical protein